MPTCENCNNQWSRKQTKKSSTLVDPTMICPYCGAKKYQTFKSRMKYNYFEEVKDLGVKGRYWDEDKDLMNKVNLELPIDLESDKNEATFKRPGNELTK